MLPMQCLYVTAQSALGSRRKFAGMREQKTERAAV